MSNKLTEDLTSTLFPKAALIAYQTAGMYSASSYLEFRKINDKGEMSAGMPVPYSFLKSISEEYVDSVGGIPNGIIPSNMLFCDTRRGTEKYVWYNPPCKRMMFFRKNLGLENKEYHIPGIIYVARENDLTVFAYKDKVPTEKTKLFYGPFFNTTNGSVCLGSANISKPTNPSYKDFLTYWEKRFWLTEFTHLGGSSNPTKNNLVTVTKNSIDKPFDVKELISANTTIKDILQ